MKRLVVIGMLAATLVAGAQTRDEAERMLKAARNTELVDGNLNAAISQYDVIIARFRTSDRAVTASALVRKAECLQKQGNAEARKIFEQVVKDYADQKEAVAQATAHLGVVSGVWQATRAVWTGPKADGSEFALSPDGRFISFPDWDTGNLGLHDLVTGADRLLTNTGALNRGEADFAEVSAISRDGKQVAYAWYDEKRGGYELRVVGLDGNPNPRRVFEPSNVNWLAPRDWSPDGKWIVANVSDKKTDQVVLIGAQDGSVRPLKSGTDSFDLGGFSRDGRYLVYTRRQGLGSPSRGYILSVDGTSEVPLMSGTSTVELPEWTPDGSRIVFVSDRSGSLGLWSIRVADGKPAGEPELLSTNDLGNARVMRFARDGSLYYGVNLSQTDIYVAGLDPASGKLTAEPRRVNERAVGNSWGRVAWLPDGKSLSFWNRKPIAALVVHTLATAEVREIWGGKSGRTGPGYSGWFQDGNSLMSVARQPDGQPWVFSRVDSRTGDVQATWTVAGLPVDSDSWFSPDLMTMFFVRKDEAVPCEGARCTYALVARDIQTGRDREIVRHSANRLWGTSISSDGRNVAFIARDPLGTSIMIAPSAGGPSREIYRGTNDGYFWSTAWARDGGHLLALHNQAPMPGGELWSFPAKGGPPEKSPLRVRPSEKPAVSPDGTQIAFVGGSAKSEVWVMTGLLKDAKKAPER